MNRRRLFQASLALLVLAVSWAGAAETHGEIPWLDGQGPAFKQADETSRPLLVDVWAVWCEPCKLMEKTTYVDPRVLEAVRGFVPLKVDADANEVFAERYRADILPTTLILDGDGNEIARWVGLVGADELAGTLSKVSAGYAEYVDQVSRKRDPVALQAAAGYLLDVGNPGRAADLLKRSVKVMKGADAEDLEAAELRLAHAQLADGQASNAAKTLARLSDGASTDDLKARALQGLVLAERSRGHEDRAQAALARLREEYPERAAELGD